MEAPWGECDKNSKLNYSDRVYSKQACIEDCFLSYLLETCGCIDSLTQTVDLSTTAPVCSYGQTTTCSTPARCM